MALLPAAVLLLAALSGGAAAQEAGPAPPADRRAVEQVLWAHRLWPADNPGPKPPLAEVLPDAVLGARVADERARERALAARWGRAIGRQDLQAEMDRMAASTRDPGLLRALFAVLGDDPARVAEALARPQLVERWIRASFASDREIQAAARGRVRREPPDQTRELAWAPDDEGEPWDARLARLAGWFGRRGGPDGRRAVDPAAIPVGAASPVQESDDRFFAVTVLENAAGRIRLRVDSWAKVSFDAWWAGARDAFAAGEDPVPASGLTLPAITAAGCVTDTWAAIPEGGVPDERDSHVAVWTGAEMVVWGGAGVAGALATGGRYRPATDTWLPVSTAGAPSARWRATAVWTGTRMVVWGGGDAAGFLHTGGRYDPATDSWQPTSTGSGVPLARQDHTAVWTGTRMIVWGGDETAVHLGDGARYDPVADAWTPVSNVQAPSARYLHTAVWTGSRMVVWGGLDDLLGPTSTGGRYDPATDSWSATSGSGAPLPRSRHAAAWTGSRMVVWGGSGTAGLLDTGGRYDPGTDTWLPTSTGSGVPSARYLHTALWGGSRVLVWGGYQASGYTGSGARYDPSADAWTPMAAAAAPGPRGFHTAVWSGTEMIVWGGYLHDGSDHELDTGGRYDPSADRWVPTSAWADRRRRHVAAWTGTEMVVWGGEAIRTGEPAALRGSGGRYVPATGAWTSTAMPGAPSPRERASAVWTGTEVVVWGGRAAAGAAGDGARYAPAADTWTAVPATGAPAARYVHTAVWSGTEMIVWGGWSGSASLATGGRYAPGGGWTALPAGPAGRYGHSAVWSGSEMIVWGGKDTLPLFTGGRWHPSPDGWTPTSTGAGVPTARSSHTAVWTGSAMIVWGGTDGTERSTGALYAPASDSWSPTSNGPGLPGPRAGHAAVWTGSEMVVWGGSVHDPSERLLGDGGRYDPALDGWTPTAAGPSGRDGHTAVWDGARMLVCGGRDPGGSLDTGGAYCAAACASEVPTGTPTLAVERIAGGARISWTAFAGAEFYDLDRGGLGTLRGSGGDFGAATDGCLADDTVATGADDLLAPAAGGTWYLVRGANCAGPGTFDDGGRLAETRDPEIATAPPACP